MRDITLGDTFRHFFTTRQFSDGVPTLLSGSPVLSVIEEANATPITAGVSLLTDRASVAGLNEATIIATAGNGYETGKSYGIYISTGTVGGVTVIGEVVGEFTVEKSAAAIDLANGTDGLGAIKSETALIKTEADKIALVTAGAGVAGSVIEEVLNRPTTAMRGTDGVDTATMRGTNSALLAASAPTNFGDLAITVTTGRVDINTNNDKTGYALTVADKDDIVDRTFDEAKAGHVAAGSFGEEIQAHALSTEITALNDITPAEVNAEVLDVIDTDIFGEPTGAPGVSATLREKISRVYQALRNRVTVTSTTKTFFDDALVTQWTKALTDDATTYQEEEGV